MSHSFEAVSRRFVPKSVPKSATGEHLGGRVRERLLTDLGELLTGVRDSHTVSKQGTRVLHRFGLLGPSAP